MDVDLDPVGWYAYSEVKNHGLADPYRFNIGWFGWMGFELRHPGHWKLLSLYL